MQITGGTVSFLRSVQPAQYETKKAEVILTFTLGEGELLEDKLDAVATLAQSKALEMVGAPKTGAAAIIGGAATRTKADIEKEMADKLKAADTATKEDKVTKRPPSAKKAADEAKAAAEAVALPDEGTNVRTQHTVKEGTGNSSPADREISKNPESRTDPADSLDDLLGIEPAAKVITDDDMNTALTRHNAKIKNSVAIRQLVVECVVAAGGKAPCQARDIPQDKRAAFLEALVKL